MKPKTLILMATAIVCGLGASYMTSRLLAERGQSEEVAKVTVLVAKKHLPMSTQMKKPEDLLEPKEFVQGDEPKNALAAAEIDKVKAKFLKRSLRKGDFLTAEDLVDNLNALDVPPGMRALGVRVNLSEIAGGFASLPGSKVDIISTVRRPNEDDSNANILLENVLVLAADQTNRSESTAAVVASVVTVAVSPEDALRVTLAKDLGPLTLILRGQGDATKAEKNKVSVTELRRVPGGKVEVAESKKFEEPPARVVEKTTKVEAPPVLTPEPEVRKHIVTVVEGEHTRKVVFLLNDNGEVSQEEVTQTPALAPLPPPAAAPARPVTGPGVPPLAGPKTGPRGSVAQAR